MINWNKVKFAADLKQYRFTHWLTLRQMDRLSGVHYSHIHKYEHKMVVPTILNAYRLCNLMRKDINNYIH